MRPLPYDRLTVAVGSEVEPVIEAFRDSSRGRTFLMPPAPEKLAGSTVDISHECLLRRWDLLRSWVEAEARDARMFNLIADEADQARRQESATGTRNPLAGATLNTYESWRNQAQPSAAWARRYEGAPDPQLGWPARQFAGAMEYLDWSIAVRKKEVAKAGRLKYAVVGLTITLAVVGAILENERDRRVQGELASTQHEKDQAVLNVDSAQARVTELSERDLTADRVTIDRPLSGMWFLTTGASSGTRDVLTVRPTMLRTVFGLFLPASQTPPSGPYAYPPGLLRASEAAASFLPRFCQHD